MPDATIASLDGGILVTLHNDLVVNQGGQIGGQDAITNSFEAIQKEFGLLSDRISIGKEKNIAFLRGNYGVFTG